MYRSPVQRGYSILESIRMHKMQISENPETLFGLRVAIHRFALTRRWP